MASSVALDPRTFHLFSSGELLFFYSVDQGVLIELNRSSYDLLQLCRTMAWHEVDAEMAKTNPAWSDGNAQHVLEPLLRQDLFRYVPFNAEEQMTFLDRLWKHKPRRLQLLLAQHCNLKCLYCYEEYNGSNARHRLMSMERAEKCVDFLVERSGQRNDLQITFFGGEPLLNWKVLRGVVDYCRRLEKETEKRFTFELITNGSLLHEEVLAFLIEQRFLLMISIDGYREMHTHNRPSVSGKDLYDTILTNAKRAHAAYKASGLGLPVKVRANMTHEHHDLERIVRFLESEGFTTIGVSTVDNLPWAEINLHACSEEDMDEVEEQRRRLTERGLQARLAGKRCSPYESKMVADVMSQVQKTKFTRGLRCGVGRNTNIVDTQGNIYPCHRYGDMREYIIGNVDDGELDERKMRAYYESVNAASNTKCSGCWARNLCGGPCAWEVSHPSGYVIEPREEHCRRIRSGFEEILVLRDRLTKEAPNLVPEDQTGCGGLCSCG